MLFISWVKSGLLYCPLVVLNWCQMVGISTAHQWVNQGKNGNILHLAIRHWNRVKFTKSPGSAWEMGKTHNIYNIDILHVWYTPTPKKWSPENLDPWRHDWHSMWWLGKHALDAGSWQRLLKGDPWKVSRRSLHAQSLHRCRGQENRQPLWPNMEIWKMVDLQTSQGALLSRWLKYRADPAALVQRISGDLIYWELKPVEVLQ